jgi:Tfp pilus assembly protein PilV
MVVASLIVSIASLLISAGTLTYFRSQTKAIKVQAAAAETQAAATITQAAAAAAQLEGQKRRQASQVQLAYRATNGAAAGVLSDSPTALVYKAVVTNTSERPIRNISCRLIPLGQEPFMPAVCSLLMDYPIASGATGELAVQTSRATHWQVLSAGQRVSFVFAVEVEKHSRAYMEARFADDNKVDWEIDGEEHLIKLPEREGW